jgi:2-hydroxychromene-2-carboxylate isomerase
MSDTPSLTIEVFADVGCPFAHLGLLAVVQHGRVRHRDVVLQVRAWPLELVNGKPTDGAFIAEEIDEIRPQVAPDQFRNFTVAAFPDSTLPAMELSAAAYGVDDRTGQAVALAVRHALFEQGLNVGDADVLAGIALEHNVPWPAPDEGVSPAQQIRNDWAEGVHRGVVGSPHFFSPDGGYFCPSLDVSRDDAGHLHVTVDQDLLSSFLDDVLGSA